MVEEPRRPADDVFAPERQEHIARMVEEHGRVRVADLSEQFRVSAVTIRKDLLALESRGRLIRAHGGAIAKEGRRPESAFDVRERLNRAAKDQIGRAAAERVERKVEPTSWYASRRKPWIFSQYSARLAPPVKAYPRCPTPSTDAPPVSRL